MLGKLLGMIIFSQVKNILVFRFKSLSLHHRATTFIAKHIEN